MKAMGSMKLCTKTTRGIHRRWQRVTEGGRGEVRFALELWGGEHIVQPNKRARLVFWQREQPMQRCGHEQV